MDTLPRLAALLGEPAAERINALGTTLTELRLRAGAPIQLIAVGHREWIGQPMPIEGLRAILSNLLDYSHHAHQAELNQGFFTLPDGSRVGICGKHSLDEVGRPLISEIRSLCVRIARNHPGCADRLFQRTGLDKGLVSLLIVSPPGMGKTTMLRELARLLSMEGRCVAIADERHEIAACHRGIPTLDVGPCADVMDGGSKSETVRMLIRAMAPEVIVTDEIDGFRDAVALSEARRCGVALICSAHGEGLEALKRRAGMVDMLSRGVFDYLALLGGKPGRIAGLWKMEGRDLWSCV